MKHRLRLFIAAALFLTAAVFISACGSAVRTAPPSGASAAAVSPATVSLSPAPSPSAAVPTPDGTAQPSVSPSAQATGKIAYLTFDDGPSKLTGRLLKTLSESHAPATFFVVGLNAEKYPDTLKQMAADGNVIGVHSWTHQYSSIYKSTQNFFDDFDKLSDYITKQTGVAPKICRFPGGTNNTVSLSYNKNHIMRAIVKQVHAMGFEYYDWNVSSGEANAVSPSEAEVRASVVGQCRNKTTALILFHDTDNPDYVDAIPGIVSDLRSLGFSFRTLAPGDPPVNKLPAVQFKPA